MPSVTSIVTRNDAGTAIKTQPVLDVAQQAYQCQLDNAARKGTIGGLIGGFLIGTGLAYISFNLTKAMHANR